MKKLSEELIEELAKWVADDVPIEYCCDGVGIHPTTFYGWMKTGENDLLEDKDNTLEATLYLKIKMTYAGVVRDSIAKIKKGGMGWTGEAWMRERRDQVFTKLEKSEQSENLVIKMDVPKNHK